MPPGFLVSDTPQIQKFVNLKNSRGEPMLSQEFTDTTGLESPVRAVQERLLNLLRKNDNFMLRHRKPAGNFQIHTGKVMHELGSYLIENGLAKRSARPSNYREEYGQWISVESHLGEAIMSVIAIAIAKHKGLDIVTSSGVVHHALAVLDEEEVFTSLGGVPRSTAELPTPEIADEIAQLVLTAHFDLDRLSAEQIAELNREGKDLRAFKTALMPIAESVPTIRDPIERTKRLQEKAFEVIEEWKKYKRSLPKFAADALMDASDMKFPEVASALLAGGTGLAIASGSGLAIGLLVWKGLNIWRKFKKQTDSPYNYLTRIEKAGATLVLPPKVTLGLKSA